MIKVIHSTQDPQLQLLEQDPVRPHIPAEHRVGKNGRIFVLMHQEQVQSVVCVALSDHVVVEEHDLFSYQGDSPTVAILYTIWSLAKGGGAAMIVPAREQIKHMFPTVNKLITLSPHTDMARKFHIRNGAHELQMNPNTVNFEYDMH